MDGLYAEARAKKKMTIKDQLVRFAVIAGMLVCFILGFLTMNVFLLIFGVVFLGLTYYLLPRLHVEYEYVFCDGQLDFDKISGGMKRKNMLRIDFEQLVTVAPKNSHALDGYRHDGVAVKDFTSLEKDHTVYGIVISGGEKPMLIYFEPNEKMLAAMKQKAPRKISEC